MYHNYTTIPIRNICTPKPSFKLHHKSLYTCPHFKVINYILYEHEHFASVGLHYTYASVMRIFGLHRQLQQTKSVMYGQPYCQ